MGDKVSPKGEEEGKCPKQKNTSMLRVNKAAFDVETYACGPFECQGHQSLDGRKFPDRT